MLQKNNKYISWTASTLRARGQKVVLYLENVKKTKDIRNTYTCGIDIEINIFAVESLCRMIMQNVGKIIC